MQYCLVLTLTALLCLGIGVLTGIESARVLGPCALHGVRGYFSCLKAITPPSNTYWDGRKHGARYSRKGVVQTLARKYAADALTMLDVGSFIPNAVASFDWIPTKVATDVQDHHLMGWNKIRGLSFVIGDFLALQFATRFDLVTCTQVLEHLSDTKAKQFVRKLQKQVRPNGGVLIASVPFEMPSNWLPCRKREMITPHICGSHLQDPLTASEFASWFKQPGVRQRASYGHKLVNESRQRQELQAKFLPVRGSIVEHVILRGKLGVQHQQTWANGTLIPVNHQVVVWRRE